MNDRRLRWLAACAVTLGSSAYACAHHSAGPREPEAPQTAHSPEPNPLDAGPSIPWAAVRRPGADAGLTLQRALAPRPDIASQSMQQHDNPRALASARCQQQERCGFVHQGSKFMSPEQCLTVVLEEQRDRLVRYSCAASTDELALQSCLEAVRAMDCAHPFESFDSVSECESRRVCRGTNAALPSP